MESQTMWWLQVWGSAGPLVAGLYRKVRPIRDHIVSTTYLAGYMNGLRREGKDNLRLIATPLRGWSVENLRVRAQVLGELMLMDQLAGEDAHSRGMAPSRRPAATMRPALVTIASADGCGRGL